MTNRYTEIICKSNTQSIPNIPFESNQDKQKLIQAADRVEWFLYENIIDVNQDNKTTPINKAGASFVLQPGYVYDMSAYITLIQSPNVVTENVYYVYFGDANTKQPLDNTMFTPSQWQESQKYVGGVSYTESSCVVNGNETKKVALFHVGAGSSSDFYFLNGRLKISTASKID